MVSVSRCMLLGLSDKNTRGMSLGSGLARFDDFALKIGLKYAYACCLLYVTTYPQVLSAGYG